MLYMEYIQKAKELVIEQCDNGSWYLIPEWKYVLFNNGLLYNKFRDFKTDVTTIEDNLKLEVEYRNKKQSKVNSVVDWIDELITAKVEPAILEEETEYIKNVMEYMQLSHQLQNTGDFDGDEEIEKINDEIKSE